MSEVSIWSFRRVESKKKAHFQPSSLQDLCNSSNLLVGQIDHDDPLVARSRAHNQCHLRHSESQTSQNSVWSRRMVSMSQWLITGDAIYASMIDHGGWYLWVNDWSRWYLWVNDSTRRTPALWGPRGLSTEHAKTQGQWRTCRELRGRDFSLLRLNPGG